ncbi:MAG TPA: ChaN family lipoprotein, partial [Desulfobacterales bacterium]|nr:ChaN family lipoprotein [Desulfobacterales bacterium]
MSAIRKTKGPRIRRLLALAAALLLAGCAVTPKMDTSPSASEAQRPETIISGSTGQPVSFDVMLADLLAVAIIYVGEKHTSAAHHAVQLHLIRALHLKIPQLTVALEMFDRSYQGVLDLWSAGRLDEDGFLRRSHWYANWRFDYTLYRDILEYAREHRLRLVALNLPFNIPPKIRVGGLEHLSTYEKGLLPAQVDTGIAAHREYAQKVFGMHEFKSSVRFEDFYLAQCVWEDVMAESILGSLGDGRMVVLAGNGHIQYKYGIPERAFKRNHAAYRTIYQASQGEEIDPSVADY